MLFKKSPLKVVSRNFLGIIEYLNSSNNSIHYGIETVQLIGNKARISNAVLIIRYTDIAISTRELSVKPKIGK